MNLSHYKLYRTNTPETHLTIELSRCEKIGYVISLVGLPDRITIYFVCTTKFHEEIRTDSLSHPYEKINGAGDAMSPEFLSIRKKLSGRSHRPGATNGGLMINISNIA